jgi:hypothetical protein
LDESQKFAGFGCSECQWVFKSTGALVGVALDQMKKEFEAERDKQFAAHACAQYSKSTEQKSE